MYFGSVRFFKHLFLGILIFMIVLPTSLAFYFGLSLDHLKNEHKTIALFEEEYPVSNAEIFDNLFIKSSTLEYIDAGVNPDFHLMDYESVPENPHYQSLFPELNVSSPSGGDVTLEKSAYLTFDDGPSARTVEILDLLKEKNIKGTFFIVGNNLDTEANRDILRRIVAEGHTVGIHTMSHVYSDIYESVEAYLSDFNQLYDLIYQITGARPEIFRFPGGSINAYNRHVYQELISEMIRRGFVYYDWNVSAADTVGAVTVNAICDNVIRNSQNKSRAFILMHDSADKTATVKSLHFIIDELSKDGFTFMPVSPDVKPIVFGYKN